MNSIKWLWPFKYITKVLLLSCIKKDAQHLLGKIKRQIELGNKVKECYIILVDSELHLLVRYRRGIPWIKFEKFCDYGPMEISLPDHKKSPWAVFIKHHNYIYIRWVINKLKKYAPDYTFEYFEYKSDFIGNQPEYITVQDFSGGVPTKYLDRNVRRKTLTKKVKHAIL